MKCIVTGLLILEALDTVLVTHAVFVYSVVDHAHPELLDRIVWSTPAQLFPSALIVAAVQYVWIMRIWTLSRSRWRKQILIALFTLVIIEAAASITCMIVSLIVGSWVKIKGAAEWAVTASFILRAVNDLLIAGYLCWCLQGARNGFLQTDGLIRKMMIYGLNTGLLCCSCSLALVISLAILPTKLYFVATYFVVTRVYANSLLAMLNWRKIPPSRSHSRANAKNITMGSGKIATEIELTSAHVFMPSSDWTLGTGMEFDIQLDNLQSDDMY